MSHIAQLEERLTFNQKVIGSNPIVRTRGLNSKEMFHYYLQDFILNFLFIIQFFIILEAEDDFKHPDDYEESQYAKYKFWLEEYLGLLDDDEEPEFLSDEYEDDDVEIR